LGFGCQYLWQACSWYHQWWAWDRDWRTAEGLFERRTTPTVARDSSWFRFANRRPVPLQCWRPARTQRRDSSLHQSGGLGDYGNADQQQWHYFVHDANGGLHPALLPCSSIAVVELMPACGSCGTELWKGAAGGLCPKCFLREGLAEPAEAIAVEVEAQGSEADASAPPHCRAWRRLTPPNGRTAQDQARVFSHKRTQRAQSKSL
jgi:hypothetical protein